MMKYHDQLSIRKADDFCFVYPDVCPYLKQALIEFGHTVEIEERLSFSAFVSRVETAIGTTRANQMCEQIRFWMALMESVTGTLITEGRMPPSFNWKHATYHFDDYLGMLGPAGLKHAIVTARDHDQRPANNSANETVAA